MQGEKTAHHSARKLSSDMERKEVNTSCLPVGSPILSSTWSQVSTKKRRKGPDISEKRETKKGENSISTSNRFLPLTILCEQLDGLSDFSKDKENPSLIQTAHKNNILSKKGFKIPTLVNGHISESEVRNSEPTHKVEIMGDSHLAGSAMNMNQFLNSKFSVTSLIKPGAPIKM
jgi:hypothetical protein